MVDVIMEGGEGEVEELGPSLSDDLITQTFPFSPVVPATLEARNGLPAAFKEEKGEMGHETGDNLALRLAHYPPVL